MESKIEAIEARHVIAASLLVFICLFLLGPLTIAQLKEDANDTILLNVNISELAAIEVIPTSISWVQIGPGTNGTDADIKNISVKNIGSYNLTNFYFDIDTEDREIENPLQSGEIAKYSAGGFVMVRNETDTLDYFLAGRLEWNLTEVLDTEVLSLSAGVINYSHGWYRKANGNEYLWKLENGTGGVGSHPLQNATCNSTDTNLEIIKLPENASGYSRDFSVGANVAVATVPAGATQNWTFFHYNATSGGPLENYCVAAYWDCTRIFIYKYDKSSDSPNNFGTCAMARYFATERLGPGERIDKLKIKPSVPQGVPAGNAAASILTVYTSIDP